MHSKDAVIRIALEEAKKQQLAPDGKLHPQLKKILELCCDYPKLFSGKNVLQKSEKDLRKYLCKIVRISAGAKIDRMTPAEAA